jgi:hypothetical protein
MTLLKSKKNIIVISLGILAVTGTIFAGHLSPTNTFGTSFVTLSDIYEKLQNNVYSTSSRSFAPVESPAGTHHTLQEIYDLANSILSVINPENIIAGNSILGIAGTYDVSELSPDKVREGIAYGTSSVGTLLAYIPDSSKQITAFNFEGLSFTPVSTIREDTKNIYLVVPAGTSISNLISTISISDKAIVSPESGVNQNFSSPVTYTVTAEDLTTQDYTVIVTATGPEWYAYDTPEEAGFWPLASSTCSNLLKGGGATWHLPHYDELRDLRGASNGLPSGFQNSTYWSEVYDFGVGEYYYVHMGQGWFGESYPDRNHYSRCVR